MKACIVRTLIIAFSMVELGCCFFTEDSVERASKHCRAQIGEEKYNVISLDDSSDNPDLKCLLACVLEDIKLTNSEGDILMDVIEQFTDATIKSVFIRCAKELSSVSDRCEKAVIFLACVENN